MITVHIYYVHTSFTKRYRSKKLFHLPPVYASRAKKQTRVLEVTAFCLYTCIHTHPFNNPLSGATRVSRYQKGKSNLDFTEARDSEWQWHRLGICKSAPRSRQITMPAPHHSVFLQAGCPSRHPTNSVKAHMQYSIKIKNMQAMEWITTSKITRGRRLANISVNDSLFQVLTIVSEHLACRLQRPCMTDNVSRQYSVPHYIHLHNPLTTQSSCFHSREHL